MVKFEQIIQNLQNIGNPDPNICEQVFTFWHVNREQNKFNQDQYEYLLKKSIDNIQNKQQVLVRSYSLLLLDCLLQADSSYNLFDENDYQIVTSSLIEYMTLETDFRGYDPKLGFIHALSHLSDCIYTLNYNNKVNIDQLRELTTKGFKDRLKVTAFLEQCDIDHLLSSPYKRTVDTISDFGNKHNYQIIVDQNLRERKVSDQWINNFSTYSKQQWEDLTQGFYYNQLLTALEATDFKVKQAKIKARS